jgi:hypothetical protein
VDADAFFAAPADFLTALAGFLAALADVFLAAPADVFLAVPADVFFAAPAGVFFAELPLLLAADRELALFLALAVLGKGCLLLVYRTK